MKITCQQCQAKYSIADDKVQGKTAKIRCKKCNATIVVGGPGSDASSATTGEAPTSYNVQGADGSQKQMTMQDLADAYAKGTITGETYIWADGMQEWLPLANVPDVVAALGATNTPEGSSDGNESAPAQPAARRDPNRRSIDLFGAAAEADDGGLISSAKDSKESRGSAPGAPGGIPDQRPTGSRNEQSTLFSLDALTAGTNETAKKPNTEDSGLIDLAALTLAAADTNKNSASANMMPNISAPLNPILAPPPPGMAPAMDMPATVAPTGQQAKSGNTAMIIGGALVLAAAIVAAAFILKPPDPNANPNAGGTTTATTTAAATTTTPAATTDTATASTDTPPADSAKQGDTPPTSKTAATSTAKTGDKKTPPTDTAKTATPPATTTTPPPPTTTTPKANPCGCAPNDLMCNMKCTGKKK